MNPIILLLSFSPWIVFGILAGHSLISLEIALIVSTILSVLVNYKDLKKKMLVSWVTLIYFVVVSILIIGLQVYAVIPYIGIASNAVLTLIGFGSLAIGMPFTLQYARQEVPKEKWDNPDFIHINNVMTAVWGVLFLIGLVNSLIQFVYPDALGIIGDALMYIVIVVGIVFNMKYPPYIKQKIQERRAAEARSKKV